MMLCHNNNDQSPRCCSDGVGRRRQHQRHHGSCRNMLWSLLQCSLYCFLFLSVIVSSTYAWEWSDFVIGGMKSTTDPLVSSSSSSYLSIQDVGEMRVRDIKRRLTRHHGYSAEEVGRILDKKELIHTLAFEEEKIRRQIEEQNKRTVMQQGLIAAIVAIFVVLCWPMFQHAYEVAMVNIVVYTDRKKHEARRCYSLQSFRGLLGIVVMGTIDVLQIWLTVSILLSWVIPSSKYYFPIPRLTLRPADFMNAEMAASSSSSFANYGINIGSMLITWVMRFLYSRIERWTGQVFSAAHRQQQQQRNRNNNNSHEDETDDEKLARKAARRAAKLERQQRQQQQQLYQQEIAAAMRRQQRPPPPPEWAQYTTTRGGGAASAAAAATQPSSDSHDEFLKELIDDTVEHIADESIFDVDGSDDAVTSLDELD